MTFKHYSLITSLLAVIFSFFFFGRAQGVYMLMLTLGLISSSIFLLIVLFGKEKFNTKIKWLGLVLISVLIQYTSEQLLIKSSFSFYIFNNNSELTEVIQILDGKTDIAVRSDEVNDRSSVLSNEEKARLMFLRNELDVYLISKHDDSTSFHMFGFLDVRIGISHMKSEPVLNDRFKPLKEEWYTF